METSKKNIVWVLSPAGSIRSTTEELALELLNSGPGYGNHIFFYADLTPIEDESANVESTS